MAMETKVLVFLMTERERSYTLLFTPWGNDQHLDVLRLLKTQKNHLAAEEISITQWRLKFQHLGIITKMFSIIYAQRKKKDMQTRWESISNGNQIITFIAITEKLFQSLRSLV